MGLQGGRRRLSAPSCPLRNEAVLETVMRAENGAEFYRTHDDMRTTNRPWTRRQKAGREAEKEMLSLVLSFWPDLPIRPRA